MVNPKYWSSLFLLISLLSVMSIALAQKQPAANEASTVAWKAPAGKPADFAGQDTCGICHSAEASAVHQTPHAKAPASGAYAAGCESCHGPGKAHADAMASAGNDAKATEAAKKLIFAFNGKPAENAAGCLSCHRTSKDQQHFDRSEHGANGLSCQSCHAPHLVDSKPSGPLPQRQFAAALPSRNEEQRWLTNSLLKAPQPDLCYSCHGGVRAQFALPSHHRVPEGLMKCTDCHNTHGTRNQPMLKKTNWEGCITCHAEKRGPFVFEHAVVKVEGCAACHTPHGSVDKMLQLRRESRFLCLQCHVNPDAPNVPHGRLGFQTRGDCVRCHTAIHGSNHSEAFLD